MNKLVLIMGLSVLISCEDDKENKVIDTLTITNPVNNSVIDGDVNITVSYTGESELKYVKYYINYSILDSVNAFPFSYLWNTTLWTNGNFILSAIGETKQNTLLAADPVEGVINNEIPSEANIILDTSEFYPYYKGYKYTVYTETNVCGNGDYPYCYLVYTVKVKNTGGSIAHNVTVQMTTVVTETINGIPGSALVYFSGSRNFGSVNPGESAGGSIETNYNCRYGPGLYGYNSCFEDLSLDDISIQINWN